MRAAFGKLNSSPTRSPRLLRGNRDGEALSTFGSSALEDVATPGRRHPGAKAMGPRTASVARLIGSLHLATPSRAIATRNHTADTKSTCDVRTLALRGQRGRPAPPHRRPSSRGNRARSALRSVRGDGRAFDTLLRHR